MLAVVEKRGSHAPEHDLRFILRENLRVDLARGLAVQVRDHDIGPIENAKAGVLYAAAKIHLLAEH